MILLQFSAGQGPCECQLAVTKAISLFEKQANAINLRIQLLETEQGREKHTLLSAILSVEGENAQPFADSWCGTLQWICESPYRHKYPRKNWFIACVQLKFESAIPDSEIQFDTMRASGAGGQHVNKTNSAIRATHLATGISVKVQTERSQHANKRLAILLLNAKLNELAQSKSAQHKAERRHLHYEVERGNPIRTFKGLQFKEI